MRRGSKSTGGNGNICINDKESVSNGSPQHKQILHHGHMTD